MRSDRDRDMEGRPRQARPRDSMGRPLNYGDPNGVDPVSEEPLPPPQTLDEAQRLLDGGRAFSAHEVLEAAWKAAPEPERELWQGLAQFCVGITHAQRGNRAGSATLLARGVARLRPYADAPPHGVNVKGLLTWYDTHRDAPEKAAPPHLT
ncbi:DUF309 domain-containing protein [Cryptosporangium sp. NPDC048952]|uniref:DUF309 domain-containing protein n=1 Tax=Cryptosporangium sp. NPDC048952 TaxID=3363961 RepID=UPI00371EA5A7